MCTKIKKREELDSSRLILYSVYFLMMMMAVVMAVVLVSYELAILVHEPQASNDKGSQRSYCVGNYVEPLKTTPIVEYQLSRFHEQTQKHCHNCYEQVLVEFGMVWELFLCVVIEVYQSGDKVHDEMAHFITPGKHIHIGSRRIARQ